MSWIQDTTDEEKVFAQSTRYIKDTLPAVENAVGVRSPSDCRSKQDFLVPSIRNANALPLVLARPGLVFRFCRTEGQKLPERSFALSGFVPSFSVRWFGGRVTIFARVVYLIATLMIVARYCWLKAGGRCDRGWGESLICCGGR